MEGELQKRYGLPTAISMVVGIVIGSGVFFKASKVLANTQGSMGGLSAYRSNCRTGNAYLLLHFFCFGYPL